MLLGKSHVAACSQWFSALCWDPHLSFCTGQEPGESQHPAIRELAVLQRVVGGRKCVKNQIIA